MNTFWIALTVVLIILGGLAFATLVTACVLRWLNRPVEPPECRIGGEE